jgi:hypothetical protein
MHDLLSIESFQTSQFKSAKNTESMIISFKFSRNVRNTKYFMKISNKVTKQAYENSPVYMDTHIKRNDQDIEKTCKRRRIKRPQNDSTRG